MRNMDLRRILRANDNFARMYYLLKLDAIGVLVGFPSYRKSQDEAIQKFLTPQEREDDNLVRAIKKDMRKAYYQIKANPSEYFLMGLRNLSKDERQEFLTDKFMYITMGKLIPRKLHDSEIENKFNFYNLAKNYFGRNICKIESQNDFNKFKEFALKYRELIIKPNTSALGSGIFAVTINSEEEVRKCFDDIITHRGGIWIAEERIHQSSTIAVLNESSCNTVRYLSFLNKNGFFTITPFLRTGRKGSVVDNAGAGGIFANVDVETGVVITNGFDEFGHEYESHPDSGVVFKGWQIPRYQELVETVRRMHKEVMPNHPYIGWDMALTDNGWVVIECNWGEFLNQYADHVGRKREFLDYVFGKQLD